MHLYILTRGHLDYVNRWINDLMAQYLPYEYEKGKMGMCQLAVRPVQLLEVVFPEKQMQEVLQMIHPQIPNKEEWNYNLMIQSFRRMMKLKKIPKINKDTRRFPRVRNQYVGVHGIGIKKDKIDKEGIERL